MTLLHMATSAPKRIDSMVLVSATSIFQIRLGPSCEEFRWPHCLRKSKKCTRNAQHEVTNRFASWFPQFSAFHNNDDDMNFTAEKLSAITARNTGRSW